MDKVIQGSNGRCVAGMLGGGGTDGGDGGKGWAVVQLEGTMG